MTKLLDHAVAAARALPADMQDDIARMMLAVAGQGDQPVDLTPDDVVSLAPSREQAARQEFATDEEVQAVWAKHRL